MAFEPDRRFASLTEAFEFILDRYAVRPGPERHWLQRESGLLIPREMPPYLFRGECGDFPTTTSTAGRAAGYLHSGGKSLSLHDQNLLRKLIPIVANRFAAADYELDEHAAWGLLQHYGMPTPMIDLTGNLTVAFAFAAGEMADIGRVAALPLSVVKGRGLLVDLHDHKWAHRAQQQAAFALVAPTNLLDLKSPAARAQMQLEWFEFPVTDADRAYLASEQQRLLNLSDDPSAGFLRFHLTEYVEANGKFSPDLTEWLLERVPMAPRCFLVNKFEGTEAVVFYRGYGALPQFDPTVEKASSRRYWSAAWPDGSFDRMATWNWPPAGSIAADPRTYHPDLYTNRGGLAAFDSTI